MLGLPIRQDEKPCPFYIRTGSCKFGTACKFNHPELVYGPSAAYGPTGPTIAPPSNFPMYGGFPSMPLVRPYLSNPIMQGVSGYVPFVHPSSQCALPMQQSWNTYMDPNRIGSNYYGCVQQGYNAYGYGQQPQAPNMFTYGAYPTYP